MRRRPPRSTLFPYTTLFRSLSESEHIGTILIDPRDSNTVYVAAQGPLWRSGGDRGLYKTTDGGANWACVLHISDDTGVNEVHCDPRNPDVLYASAYQRRRRVWTLIDGGPESAIHKSTDAGKTWRKITKGLPEVDMGRIGLGVSPADPDVVYAIIEAADGKSGFFRSINRGESWEKRSDQKTTSPQYYNEIVCDPLDVDRVYVLDTFMQVTEDGGKTFKRVPRQYRHVDDHALWIDPNDNNYMLVGCDGGIYESFARGSDWDFKSNLPVPQFYHVSVDNSLPFYYIYGGTQDNNSLGGPSRTRDRIGIANEHWFVTVGDRNHKMAQRRVGEHARGNAIMLDASDHGMLIAQIQKADIVVNLLAPTFQHQVAWECVEHGKHMISASYRDKKVRELHAEAQREGVLILCEAGLDPGIDHMLAMSLIHDIRLRGGIVTGFVSYGSGVPAPDSLSNPLKYAITWNPRNVVMSAEFGAQYLKNGLIKIVPYWEVFQRSWVVEVDGMGIMEAYPNRDSLFYKQTYGLKHAETMVRGTLRYPGWSETWSQIVRLGLPNEQLTVPDLKHRTYAEIIEMFLSRNVSGDSLEHRVANHLHISPTGAIMEKLRWLGLFSQTPVGIEGDSVAEALSHLLQEKLVLKKGERDMVVLVHELDVCYPEENNRREKVISTFIEYGQPDGFTAMSKTVGLPAAIATHLILADELPMTGSHIPTHPAIYGPILRELEKAGLTFHDKVIPMQSEVDPGVQTGHQG